MSNKYSSHAFLYNHITANVGSSTAQEFFMNTYQVSFSLNGVTQISINPLEVIENKLQAEAVAVGGIKLWFEQQGLPVPDFVRNVQYVGAEEYQWDILPLN